MSSHNTMNVLMYHGITSTENSNPKDREVGAELYDVKVENFKRQMQWLKDQDYTTENPNGSSPHLKDKKFILTFDDGEMNNFTEALPIIQKLGFKGYFFIIAKRIGRDGYMGWDELKKLHDAGMIIGSHGLSHEILTTLKETQVEEELHASKQNLERNLNITVEDLSIPRGFCNDPIIQMAYNMGYKNVFISDRPNQLVSDCFSRIAVKGNWTFSRFEKAILGTVPLREKLLDRMKQIAKFILRESGYNGLRNFLINISK